MFAMSLTALPCQGALLEVVDIWFHHSHHWSNPTEEEEEQCSWSLCRKFNRYETVQDASITIKDELEILSITEGENGELEELEEYHPRVPIRHEPIQS